MFQELRDFDLVTLGPPSKVLQEEQGLEVKIMFTRIINIHPRLPLKASPKLPLKTSPKLPSGIGNHFSEEIQLSPRFPPPPKPYLLGKQTCWSSAPSSSSSSSSCP